ncbi:hypothetical protein HDU98_003037 [Podochytrium sp. JEL0797]|nr:hypothetical protein HDU98_003037 [Podochytrium sp. JEL0797]
MMIQYVAVLNSYTVFATNRGIYYSTSFPSAGSSTYTQFFQSITGQSALDSGASSALVGTVVLSSTSNCFSTSESFVYVAYSTTSNGLRNNLIYVTESGISSNKWSAVIPISLTGALATYQYVSAARFSPTSLNIYLLEIPLVTPCTGVGCSNAAIVVVHNTTSDTFATSFTFPAMTTVTKVTCHVNGIDCYIFGSSLWHSLDGGQNWLLLYTLPTAEVFSKFESSHANGNFVLLTNSNNIYHGRAGTVEIVRVNTWNPRLGNLVEVMMDETGSAFGLSLATVSTYSSLSADYPMGFLKTVTGQTRDASNPYLSKVVIPLQSVAAVADVSFADTLVPVFMSLYRVQLYSPGGMFVASHVGMKVSIASGGVVVVNSVSGLGYVADCTVTTLLVSDSAAHALGQSITIGNTSLGDATNPLVADVALSSPTTLTLSMSGTGTWLLSDVGKSVVVNQGSFLITSITSDTVAAVHVIRAPLSVSMAASGSWKVYDMRSFREFCETGYNGQSITVDPVAAGVQRVVMSPNSPFSFGAGLRGMWIVTSTEWGLIQDVVDSATLKVSWFVSNSSTSSFAAGSWSIVETNDNFVPGTFPSLSFRTRPWSLKINDCPWSSFTSSLTSNAQYLSNKEQLTVSTTIQTAAYVDNPYFPVLDVGPLISNPLIYNYAISRSQNMVNHMSVSSLVLNDIGVQGMSSVSFRPAITSLSCQAIPFVSTQIVDGCSPSRSLNLASTLSESDFLSGNGTFLSSELIMKNLPVNYRPPSSLGTSIPTSSNIYNADPAAPRYNNRYTVSQRTGQFKQCAGKPTQLACGCTDALRISMQQEYSDCINRVPNVMNDLVYSPTFYVTDAGGSVAALRNRYTLVELNNRIDYCINTGTTTICSNSTSLYTTPLDPTFNASISWSSTSTELYHFRVQVVEHEFCGDLSVEFGVWVMLPTPRTGVILTYMSVVAVGFAGLLVGMYCAGVQRERKLSL